MSADRDVGRGRRRDRCPAVLHRHRQEPAVEGTRAAGCKIWEGGLGIPGGLLAGVLVGMWAIKRRGLSVRSVCSTPRRPPSRSRRPSAGWATGGTRSCSAGPPTLPWALRDRRRPPARRLRLGHHRSTPRSCTKRCGTWRCAALLILIDKRIAAAPRPAAGGVRGRATPSAASGSRACASTRPTPAAAAAQPVGGARRRRLRPRCTCSSTGWRHRGVPVEGDLPSRCDSIEVDDVERRRVHGRLGERRGRRVPCGR